MHSQQLSISLTASYHQQLLWNHLIKDSLELHQIMRSCESLVVCVFLGYGHTTHTNYSLDLQDMSSLDIQQHKAPTTVLMSLLIEFTRPGTFSL